jgi:hypothetical protein
MADPNIYDLSDVVSADLNFYAKWSIPPNEDCDGDGYIDSFWGVLIHPTSGPDSAYWWFAGGSAYYNYENDWQPMSFDLKALAEGFEYDGTIPEIEWLIGCFMCTSSGNTVPAGNPIPWSGLMIDNLQFDIVSCGSLEVVDTQYTGSLAPGATETIVLCWDDVEFSNWCFQKDVQLPGDIDPDNDICWDSGIKVRDSYPLTGWSSIDLTGGDDDDCLWQICCTRACDGTCCAWAGVIEETSGHYIPDMDDNMISPWIPLSIVDYPLGASLNMTTWYDFMDDDGDFGQIYVRNSSAGMWHLLGTVSGNSSGFFEDLSFYIRPGMFTDQIQIRLRMVSDSDDCVGEGWYVCEIELVEVTAAGPPPAPGGDMSNIIDAGASTFNWFDVADPSTINYIGAYPDPSFPQGAAYVMDELWFTDTDGDIYTIDPLTATFTFVGNSGTSGGLTCIAYDDTTSTLYGASTNHLYTIDMGSGVGTSVGPITGITSLWISMDFDNSGNLYGYDLGSGSGLYSVDKYSGAATLIGPTGHWFNFGQDMSYDKDNDVMWAAVFNYNTFAPELHLVDLTTGTFTNTGTLAGSQFTSFAIPYVSGDVPLDWGITIWSDNFDRTNIAPWTCITLTAGDHWDTQAQCISDYPLSGKGLNNAMYKMIDLTDPELYHAELYFTTEWDIEAGVEIFIEFSPDWDGIEPMQDATWIPYYIESGASTQALISSTELVDDDRFIINEFLGEIIYLRFRITTPGEGSGTGGFWCIHDKAIIFKEGEAEEEPEDEEPPVTNAFFDCETAKVTLVAIDYPEGKNCGVKATYYKIGTNDYAMYTSPVTMPEGTNTIYFYSEDLCDNTEAEKSKTYTVDTSPPTVELIVPEDGALYLFGSKIMNRILSDTTLCIGKVPVEATASDGTGSGINKVLFSFDGVTAWAESSPFTAEFKDMHFGDLVITATALDNVGLESAPDEMTVKVYSIGLF